MSGLARRTESAPGAAHGTRVDMKRPKFSVLHMAGRGWIVLDPEGVKRGGPTDSRAVAQALRDSLQAEADRRAKRGARPCLCCGAMFESAGIHNRLCDICKRRGAEGGPHGIVLPRRRTA